MNSFEKGLLKEYYWLRLERSNYEKSHAYFSGEWEELHFSGKVLNCEPALDHVYLHECDSVLIFSDCGNFVAELLLK